MSKPVVSRARCIVTFDLSNAGVMISTTGAPMTIKNVIGDTVKKQARCHLAFGLRILIHRPNMCVLLQAKITDTTPSDKPASVGIC